MWFSGTDSSYLGSVWGSHCRGPDLADGPGVRSTPGVVVCRGAVFLLRSNYNFNLKKIKKAVWSILSNRRNLNQFGN